MHRRCPASDRVRMDSLHQLLWPHQRFFLLDLHVWQIIGWMGNIAFGLRVLVQWHATEKRREVVVPLAFWWLSLLGSWCLLTYALGKRDWVIVVSNAFNWIPSLRNLLIHRSQQRKRVICPSCGQSHPPSAKFCMACAMQLGSASPETLKTATASSKN